MSINSAEIHKDNKSIRDRKQRQQGNSERYKTIRFPKILLANLYFRVRSQKACCDGHTDRINVISKLTKCSTVNQNMPKKNLEL